MDTPAGVTQEEGHTRVYFYFSVHAVYRALAVEPIFGERSGGGSVIGVLKKGLKMWGEEEGKFYFVPGAQNELN